MRGKNFFVKTIYFWLHCVFIAVLGLSLVAASKEGLVARLVKNPPAIQEMAV